MPSPGERLSGRYELIHPIGGGGMATVWRARDLRLGRAVAVKLLRPQFAEDPEFVRRFEIEAHHAASLTHPNVAQVYDTDVEEDQRFIVMELVDGPTVADVITQRGRVEPLVAVDIAAAAARALAAAHRRGLIHRDVKPANLLLGRDGRVRLADFGIARALTSSRVTTPGTVLGSIPYLSPEQARGEEATTGGDIFSLGVVLFEMLTGDLPWEADTPAAMATARLHLPAPPPSRAVASLPEGLDGIVGRALELDPTKRYTSARVLADALESWSRRHRAALGGRAEIRHATTALAASVSPAAAAASRAIDAPSLPRAAHHNAAIAAAGGAVTGTANPNPWARPSPGRGGTRLGVPAGPAAPPDVPPAPPFRADEAPGPGGAASPPMAPAAPDRSEPDRRAGVLFAILALLLVGSVVAGFFAGGGTPSPSQAPGAAIAPTPTALPTPSPTALPTPLSIPTPSLVPTVLPTSPPTPKPTPPPTPRPTVRPAPDPTSRPAAVSAPARAVIAFYDAAADHDWDRAISLWSASMQDRYPPQEWLVDRFRRTTRIDITRLVTVSQGDGRARVEVSLTEYRTVEPSPRRFVGAWDLILVDGEWLLHDPDF